MGRTVIIDYGSGNLHSAHKAFERAASEAKLKEKIIVSAKPEDVASADRIVLPGVGAFKDCRNGLMAVDGMEQAMREQVISKGRPFLGICVGMQLMATRGLEHETTQGLGWIAGDVKAIAPSDPALKIQAAQLRSTSRVVRNSPTVARSSGSRARKANNSRSRGR